MSLLANVQDKLVFCPRNPEKQVHEVIFFDITSEDNGSFVRFQLSTVEFFLYYPPPLPPFK